jgi:trimeric autotransporter adhesin
MKSAAPLIETLLQRRRKHSRSPFVLIAIALGSFALVQSMEALSPVPDGGYPGGNTAEGQNALFSLTTGTYDTAIGFSALKSNTEGQFNTAIGAGALLANVGDQSTGDGVENTAIGAGALLSNTKGVQNTANGAFALFSNTEGRENTATGAFALFHNTTNIENGVQNTADGAFALFSNTTGRVNTAIGNGALFANTTGNGNTASGYNALESNMTGGSNTASGDSALFSNTTGGFNTADGAGALFNNATGTNNTAIGTSALVNNTSGSNNIALGVGAGSNIVTASDTICIGAPGVDVTDGCYIGHVFEEALDPDHLSMAIDVNGKVGTPASSRRFKEDIKPIDKASETILALKPVSFHYKNDKKRRAQFGLIAEEVAEVDSSLVARDKEGKPYSVRYDQVNAMLLNEFLKEHQAFVEEQREVKTQEATIFELKSTVARQQKGMEALTAQLKEQAAQIRDVSAHLEINKSTTKVALNHP